MQTINLFTRLTNRYVGTYDHLNDHQHLTTAKVTPPRVVDPGNDYDQGHTVVRHVVVPSGADRQTARKIVRAIEDTFTRYGCAHEHDCCGCASYSTRAKRVARNRYVATTRVTYNY